MLSNSLIQLIIKSFKVSDIISIYFSLDFCLRLNLGMGYYLIGFSSEGLYS